MSGPGPEMSPEAFEALTRRLGLDPAHHDMAALRDAYRRLQVLFERLDPPDRPAGAQPLALFDPRRPL